MDKNFVIVYELTADTTTTNINDENTPMKFRNWKDAKIILNGFPEGCIFQVMIIGKQKTFRHKVWITENKGV